MSGGGAGNSSKQKVESSKPSDTPSFKRKRGVFQKDCEFLHTPFSARICL